MSPFPHVRREVAAAITETLAEHAEALDALAEIDREGVNELLSMPYDEPDMADVERVCDEVRHEQVPITDPRWLASTQPDPEPEIDERRGLDGNGAMHASDLPARVWGGLSVPAPGAYEPDNDEPIVRRYCLKVEPGYATIPARCRLLPEHAGDCDFNETNDAKLSELARAAFMRGEIRSPSARSMEPRDTPSDVLPRRVPGEALREAEEAAVSEFESEGGTRGHSESERAGESNLARRVIERWPA